MVAFSGLACTGSSSVNSYFASNSECPELDFSATEWINVDCVTATAEECDDSSCDTDAFNAATPTAEAAVAAAVASLAAVAVIFAQ